MLKTQDRALFIGSIMQRAIGSVVFGTFGGFGGAIADSIFLTPGIGTGIGIATGIGFAFTKSYSFSDGTITYSYGWKATRDDASDNWR